MTLSLWEYSVGPVRGSGKHVCHESCMFGSGGHTDCKLMRGIVLVGKSFVLDNHSRNP